MNNGWIKLHRKIMNWEWYQCSETVHLFIHLLFKANHKEKTWKGVIVKAGQLITGRKQLSKETGITEQSIRTNLKRLISTNEITIKSTNKYSIVTICNYLNYQDDLNINNQQNNQQTPINQPTTNQQLTTNKNVKNVKNDLNNILFEQSSNEYQLSLHLFNWIKQHNPKAKEPNFQSWCKEFDKILRIDKREAQEVSKVIDLCQQDSFWFKNILSPVKLRKQYDRLLLINQENNNGTHKQSPYSVKSRTEFRITPESIKQDAEGIKELFQDIRSGKSFF